MDALADPAKSELTPSPMSPDRNRIFYIHSYASVTVASMLLPTIGNLLIAMTLGMLVYVYSGFARILAIDVGKYWEPHMSTQP